MVAHLKTRLEIDAIGMEHDDEWRRMEGQERYTDERQSDIGRTQRNRNRIR